MRPNLDDSSGNDLEGATVNATFTLADGSTSTVTGVTNDRGRVAFQWSGLGGADFAVTVVVDTIEFDGVSYVRDVGTTTLNIRPLDLRGTARRTASLRRHGPHPRHLQARRRRTGSRR